VAGIAQQWRTGTGEPGGVFVLCDKPHCLTASPKTAAVSAVALPDRAPLQPQVKDVLLYTAHFGSGSAVLSPKERQGLQNALGRTQNAHIQVVGYTDATGSEDYNRGLAHQRAQAVRQHLITIGAQPASIVIEGRGSCCYTNTNTTPTGHAQNRRAEMRAVGEIPH
jgi:outer membrane protein OmpA-like peptidoglycan-associated protein